MSMFRRQRRWLRQRLRFKLLWIASGSAVGVSVFLVEVILALEGFHWTRDVTLASLDVGCSECSV